MKTLDRMSARVQEVFAATKLPVTLSVRAATADSPAEILCYDEIGQWGVSAKGFMAAMAEAGAGPIRVRINSPGGDVFDGLAIYNALKSHPGGVTTVVDGLAASAASFIALAGTSMEMAPNTMFMAHNASGGVWGNKADMRSTADLLDKVDGQIAGMYVAKTGADLADVQAMMTAETWFTADEAKAAGYCDVITAAPAKTKNVAEPAITASTEPVIVALADDSAARALAIRIRIAQSD